jgi:hypothetical protein
LKYPFQGNNLLALVNLIVMSQPEKIPDRYSPELQELITSLLEKDP